MHTEPTLSIAAAKAGMDEKTARRYLRLGKLPSESKRPRDWLTREDCFADVWSTIEKMLEVNSGLEAKTLFNYLKRSHPGSVSSTQKSLRIMSWIKNALIDLAITAVIAIYYFNGATWGWWIIVIYTPLMVLLKVFALSGIAHAVQRKADDVPVWFYHLLFGANVVLLVLSNLLLLAAGWAAIWILSAIAESRRPRSSSKA